MKILDGKITNKETEGDEILKDVITLDLGGDEECFVEVRSKFLRDIIGKTLIGDTIQIAVVFEGKRTKNGNRFNNIVAKNIKNLNNGAQG